MQTNLAATPEDERSGIIAPFPPSELMQVVSGLTDRLDFAARGVALYNALQDASPKTLSEFENILDFGCGSGCVARMFQGFNGRLFGCDVDSRLVDWVNANLPYMDAVTTIPNMVLPFATAQFDCIISVSVFTHLTEASQLFYLAELARCTKPGGVLLLTVHGHNALNRATTEAQIFEMIAISPKQLDDAVCSMTREEHAFALQQGHLTTGDYEYGIAFIPEAYIRKRWSSFFDIVRIVDGAIHNWQSIVVCRKPSNASVGQNQPEVAQQGSPSYSPASNDVGQASDADVSTE